jgi:eukaryotic-like serine/threonine-protein kinase
MAIEGYRELRELGSGASGRVVAAVHEASGRTVAIKFLSPELLAQGRFADGFRAEARLLAGLNDPHLVRFYEYVETRDSAAIVMELVEGCTLRALLDQEGATRPISALTVLKGSLLGLAAAHRAGVVHRDYKPANVLVSADGVSKLADFGVALAAGERTGPVGTPSYMAPEQWRGAPADPSTDVYAATVVFFECVTGQRPFQGSSLPELAAAHQHAPIPADQVPSPLRPLLERGMAKTAAQRPASAQEFLTQVERAAEEGYGRDWEVVGLGLLGTAAGALGTLAIVTNTAVGTATAAGGTTTTSTLLKPVARTGLRRSGRTAVKSAMGKAAAAVAGLVIAGTAVAVGVHLVAAKQRPKPRPASTITFTLAAMNQTLTSPPMGISNAQYPVVSGPDTALTKRINQALRGPLDTRIAVTRAIIASAIKNPSPVGGACGSDPIANGVVTDTVAFGLRGPGLVSVVYTFTNSPCGLDSVLWPMATVNVDLRTGRALTPADIFTAAGEHQLSSRLSFDQTDPNTKACGGSYYPLRPQDFSPTNIYGGGGEPPTVNLMFTANALKVTLVLVSYQDCGPALFLPAPYAKVRDLFQPSVAALVPSAA